MNDNPDGQPGEFPPPPPPAPDAGPQGAPAPPMPPPYVPTIGGESPSGDQTDVLAQHGGDAPTQSQPTVPVPPVPAAAPPVPPPTYQPPVQPPAYQPPAGYPAGPPTSPPGPGAGAPPLGSAPPGVAYGSPPYGSAPYGGAQYGAPPAPGFGTEPVEPAPPSGSKKAIAIILIAAVVLLGLGGIALIGLATFSSGSLEVGIEQCEIASDGSLSAAGTVTGVSNGNGVDITVEFIDVDTGDVVDTGTTGVDVSFAGIGPGDLWEVSGRAGDDVQQVRCDVEASA